MHRPPVGATLRKDGSTWTRARGNLKAIVEVGGPDDAYTDLVAPGGTFRAYQYEQYAPLMAAYNLGRPNPEVSGKEWARIWQQRA